MLCPKCGKEVEEDAQLCPSCLAILSDSLAIQNAVLFLKGSEDGTYRKCYELLILMLRNSEVSLDWQEKGGDLVCGIEDLSLAQEIGIANLKLKTDRGRRNDARLKIEKLQSEIYEIFKESKYNGLEGSIIGYEEKGRLWKLHRFNPRYFLDLREAVESIDSIETISPPLLSEEGLPPLTFQMLVIIILEHLSQEARPDKISYTLSTPMLERYEMFVVPVEVWESRSGDWGLFDDVAPSNLSILAYEERNGGFFVKAISRREDKKMQAFLDSLAAVTNGRMEIEISKLQIEPTGKTQQAMRRFLSDKTNIDSGITSKVARMLSEKKAVHFGWRDLSEPERFNELLRSKGFQINPFVKAAYREYLSDEEKMQYESSDLSKFGKVAKYSDWNSEGYEKCIAIPYDVSFDRKFPFGDGEQVKVEIVGDSIIIKKVSKQKLANSKS